MGLFLVVRKCPAGAQSLSFLTSVSSPNFVNFLPATLYFPLLPVLAIAKWWIETKQM